MSKEYNLSKRNLKSTGFFEQEDTPDGVSRQYVQDFNDNDMDTFEMPIPETTGETTSRRNLGRNCPFCAGRLVEDEMGVGADGESYLRLLCTSCKRKVYGNDIEHRDEVVDNLYRNISDRTFQKWEDHMNKRS